jgi:hypothetical protein
MADVTIDRLAVQVVGISVDDARRLALAVAEGLAGLTEGAGPAAELRLSVDGRAGEAVEALATRIVDAVLRSGSRTT